MAASGILRVTPERLQSTAAEFSGKASTVQGLTNQMLELVRGLNGIWQGEASTSYAQKFNSLEDDMARIYKMITEHSNDLNTMAEEFMKVEKENMEESSGLPSDAIT